MALKRRIKVQDRLRNELNTNRNIYTKRKLITVIVLCCTAMALPLPYIVQIPLLIYFGVCIKKSEFDINAKNWFISIDRYVTVIWTIFAIVYLILYILNIIKLGQCTYEAFNEIFPNIKNISWAIPMCIKYSILQYTGFNEFIGAMQTDALSNSDTWRILSKYDFVAFSSNYINTSSNTAIQFTGLVSPLSILVRLNKMKSLITVTGTAWILVITRICYWLKSRKPKH